MTNKEKILYKSARKNKEFLTQYTQVDLENKLPNLFSTDDERLVIANTYYGWLIAKYGNEYRNYL